MKKSEPISLHGGHSGQFCNHAQDSLEDIILSYIEKGFKQVGISEHIPPLEDRFLFPEEVEAGLSPRDMQLRFQSYIRTINRLQEKYRNRIRIFKGMESEAWPGYAQQIRRLSKDLEPDYIVGSVHHVNDQCFDYSKEIFDAVSVECGSVENMYLRYFDLQYDLIQTLEPFIVGHFDLIRIHDPLYRERIMQPSIQERIDRNLCLIKGLGLAMDLNLRPLSRGEKEPYPTRSILEKIRAAGIPMIPGDDSHSADQAGQNVEQAIALLESHGFDTNWPLEKITKDREGKNP